MAHYEQHISEMPVDQLAAPRHILVQSYRRRLNEREDTSALTQFTLPSLPFPQTQSYLDGAARVSKMYSEAFPLNDRLWLVQLSQQLKDDADPILCRLQKHAAEDSQALFHQFQPDIVQHLVHFTRQLSFANRVMILWLLTSSSRLSFSHGALRLRVNSLSTSSRRSQWLCSIEHRPARGLDLDELFTYRAGLN